VVYEQEGYYGLTDTERRQIEGCDIRKKRRERKDG